MNEELRDTRNEGGSGAMKHGDGSGISEQDWGIDDKSSIANVGSPLGSSEFNGIEEDWGLHSETTGL